ncbi:EsaB/YukD family protein [Microbacterium sp. RD1]|uniref:EsaB/YukD family protein n=1 Tax=Microbacterium sp. RD1 TaxID=3457313 RepID=UPI003FA571A4
MSVYTRVTVVGASGRCEVVVPSDESVGAALPRLLELLGETEGTVARPLALVTPDGEQLDIARTPTQLELLDGTMLRLVRLEAAPPPPVVIDVTDAAADAHDARPDRWDARARMGVAGSAIALASAVGGLLAPYGTAEIAAWAQLGVLVALVAVAAGVGLAGLRRVAACVSAAAAGVSLSLAVAASSAAADAGSSLLLAAAVAISALSTVVLGGVGLGQRSPGALAGGALGGVLGSLLLILLLTGVDATASAAITGTVAAFATGPLPWIALSAAGLTTLDGRAAGGEGVARTQALTAIDDAYASLTWSVAAVAAVLGATGVALVLTAELWPGLLALAFGLVAALRFRAFPLRAQGWALWVAVAALATAALVVNLAGGRGWLGAAVAAVAALAIGAGALVSPRPHVRARLRGLGNTLETLAVVALVPLLLGALGIYTELLSMFGGSS